MASQRRKCRLYRSAGVPVVWLVDPVGRSVEVFDEGRDGVALPADGVLETVELPGFRLPLVELFAVLDRETE
jgi:Uma2 family endonuclease